MTRCCAEVVSAENATEAARKRVAAASAVTGVLAVVALSPLTVGVADVVTNSVPGLLQRRL
jgi:hypothetical protein